MHFPMRAALAAIALLAPAVFAGHDLDRLVVVGDSLSAGYQNNQLIDCFSPKDLRGPFCFSKPNGQRFGYANVIAQQAGVDLKLPLIPPPGFPQITNNGGFDVANTFNFVPREHGVDQTLDIAVPGFTVQGLFYPVACPNTAVPNPPFPIQVMAAEILSPKNCASGITELGEAVAVTQGLHNETTIFWIGANDALFPLLFSGQQPTPLFTGTAPFAALYDAGISTLAKTSSHLVVANIPDITLLPYLTSVQKLALILGMQVSAVEGAFGLQDGDMVTPYAFALIPGILQGKTLGPLPSDLNGSPVVIRAAQIAALQTAIAGYNAFIAQEAATYHAVLVDIYSLVNNIALNGFTINGQTLTTNFKGGLFSLDGVHPSNTGYAIIANEFIRTMNQQLGTHIPPADLDDVAANDPMVFVPIPGESGKEHVSRGMAEGLRGLLGHNH